MNKAIFLVIVLMPALLGYYPNQQATAGDFLQRLQQNQEAVKSLSANFVQVKKNPLFTEDQQAKGKFYYVKPDKIRWEEVSPINKHIIINGDKLIQFDGASTTVTTTNGMQAGALKSFILKTVDGSIFNDKSFATEMTQSGNTILLLLTPKNKRAARHLLNVEMHFDVNSLFLEKLILRESETITTEITYSNQQRDLQLPDQLFSTQ